MAKKKTKSKPKKQTKIIPLIIAVVVIIVLIMGGRYYFESSNKAPKPVADEFIPTQDTQITDIIYPTPPDSKPGDVFEAIPVSSLWNSTLVFVYPNVDLSFKYPSKMRLDSINIAEANKKSEETYKTNKYNSSSLEHFMFDTPDVAYVMKKKPDFDWTNYENNSVHIWLDVNDNKSNLSVSDFIKQKYAELSIDLKTPAYKSFEGKLNPLTINGHEAYSYKGAGGGEVYKKMVFIPYKNKVYIFGMRGGNETGSVYTKEAEDLFDKMIQSIEFK